MKRHSQIVNINDVEPVDISHKEKFKASRKRLSANTSAKELGCSWYEVPPGKKAFPHHSHFGNEEAFFILSGEGTLRLGEETFKVTSGDFISCPAGSTAHSLINTGMEPLRYLGISTAHETDILLYPDSKKIGMAGGADMNKGLKSAQFFRLLKDQPSVDYYLDEGE